MPEVLKDITTLPARSSAIAPPSPPSPGTTRRITSSVAAWSVSPRYSTRAAMSWATAQRMKNSPQPVPDTPQRSSRSEEHTSELQSLMRISYAVFCLKKKNHNQQHNTLTHHSES